MISKKDVEEYLKEMIDMEKKMEETYAFLASKVKVESFKDKFKRLVVDEKEHGKMVKKLKNLLKKWK